MLILNHLDSEYSINFPKPDFKMSLIFFVFIPNLYQPAPTFHSNYVGLALQGELNH